MALKGSLYRKIKEHQERKKEVFDGRDVFGNVILICPKCELQSLYWYQDKGYYSCANCGLKLRKEKKDEKDENKDKV